MSKSNKNINIYITFDGLSDPLGQGQILPYLNNLNIKENIYIFSLEKKKLLNKFFYTNSFITNYSILFKQSKLKSLKLINIINFMLLILKKTFYKKIKIIHCRGLYPAILGLILKKLKKTKLIYDMRGFGVEEKIDNKVINLNSFLGKALFRILKYLEKKVIMTSDEIVVLTNRAKQYLKKNYTIKSEITVIPCSVNYDKFDSNNYKNLKIKLHKRLKLTENPKILIYIGSFGEYYLHEDIFNLFEKLNENINNLYLLIVTNDKKSFQSITKYNRLINKIRIKTVNWKNIPKILSIADLSISLIRPTFAKIASTPTKVSESLAMGIPVILNANIGDYDEIFAKEKLGFILKSNKGNVTKNEITQIKKLLLLKKLDIRKNSKKFYCLEKAIKKYNNIYERLT